MFEPSKGAADALEEGKFVGYPLIAATLGLSAIIALAPFPFGSMDSRVIAVWVVLLSAVLLLASLQAVSARDLAFLFGFAAVGLAWILVVSEQLARTPIFSQQLVAPIWKIASSILGEELDGSVSIARNQPYFSAGSQIACTLSMVCGFLVGRNRRAAASLLMSFAVSALAYSAYGILAFVFWPNYLLWHQKYNYLNSLTATFVNPNVAATYFGAAALAWTLMLSNVVKGNSAGATRRWSELVSSFFRNPSRRTVWYFTACFIIFAATFLTGSRAGTVLSLLMVTGAVGTFYRRELRTRRLLLVFPIAAAFATLAALLIFAPRVNQRFGAEGFFDVGRWNAYTSSIDIIGDYPWLGSGLGTFRWVFPAYRSGDIPSYGIWEQAHNTTLEIASEMGIPFTILLGAAWLAIFLILGRGMLRRRRDAIFPISAFWIGLLAILHSQVDFPLQIPGLSLAICPLIGMGLAQSVSSKREVLT